MQSERSNKYLRFKTWTGRAVLPFFLFSVVWSEAASLPPESTIEKSDIMLPLISTWAPGFGQYVQGDRSKGYAYTGVGAVGLGLVVVTYDTLLLTGSTEPTDSKSQLLEYGLQLYQTAGFLSAYDSFRRSVYSFHSDKQYEFYKEPDPISDLLKAPFRFSYLKKPTTFLPLALISCLGALSVAEARNADKIGKLDMGDCMYLSGASYNAGVAEEAYFRGWIFPTLYQRWGHRYFLSNLAQALIFGAAHYPQNRELPWPQTLIGYYFGYLCKRNKWHITEQVFIHVWWDVIAIAVGFLTYPYSSKACIRIQLPTIQF